MRSRVMYVSKGKKASAKTIGEAIAQGARIACDPVETHTAVTDVDILFLGCEMSFGKINSQLRKLAQGIDPSQVKQVVAFSVGSAPDKTALAELKGILEPKGIKVNERELFFTSKITDKEIKDAEAFGASIVSRQ